MGNVTNCCEKRGDEYKGMVDLGQFKRRPKKIKDKELTTEERELLKTYDIA
jgi:hypothetical protein